MNKLNVILFSIISAVSFTACNNNSDYPDVTGKVRDALKASGYTQVDVSQDRQKGVVKLTGNLPSEQDKAKAESIARNEAGDQVLADEIAVVPSNDSNAKTVNSDLDKAIEKNLDAALVKNRLNKTVNYSVKNGVVTLTGNVRTQQQRAEAEKIAKSVPNVTEVVNELQLKNMPATSR